MAPPGSGKRKRGDRSYSGDDFQRPSPHRPGNLPLAQQHTPNRTRDYLDNRPRGGRRPSRGGRGAVQSSVAANGNIEMPPPQTISQDSSNTSRTNGSHPINPELQTAAEEEDMEDPVARIYNYEYLTEEVISTWATDGRQKIVNCGIQAFDQKDDSKLAALMQEMVQVALYGGLYPADAGDAIKQIGITAIEGVPDDLQAASPNILQATFLDIVCVCTESDSEVPIRRLAKLILATEIPAELLRQELDSNLLEKLGLIRNTFTRVGIRKQTNLLYRQANFNLMREESEGFAKLMTELFTTSGTDSATAQCVGDTIEKVKAMIGAFDLDVGRSLDVVLDVFGAVLVRQCRFFVKFLRASPWWPRGASTEDKFGIFRGLPYWALPSSEDSVLTEDQKEWITNETLSRDKKFWIRAREVGFQAFYELGHRIASNEEREAASVDEAEQTFTQSWIQETGTLPPSSNRDAAQLLGFKLRFYSSSAARDESDVLPDNLIYLSALLIKIGFISLSDLYPHIWRSDSDMEELRKLKTVEKTERERASRPGAGARNALLLSAPLSDDTLPIPSRLRESGTRSGTPSRTVESERAAPATPTNHEAADQKVLLMKSLFAIGALPEALFILGRFPWLLDLYPELPEYLHRILHHSLSRQYILVQPLTTRETLREQKPMPVEVLGLPKGQIKLTEAPKRKVLRWPLLDRDDSTDGLDYRFYWDEWNDNIPVCQSIDDVFLLCDTFLELVGVKIGQDPSLLLKFARIGKHSMSTDKSEFNRTRWLNLSKRFLLPALSLTKSNAGVVNEVFELVNNFPINVRYLMYLEWYSGRTSRNPDIKAAFDQARAETKDVLKRISKTNVRPMARALAKIAYANPHIVITTALAQIEVYDSIAEVFVEGARYFTDLGYDILTWAMISSMARAGRSRTGESGLFTSKWLAALSSFAGKIFKRYNIMRPGPILQYVEDQLSRGNSGDLAMLEQIISSMAGIASDANYNDAQLQAMGGGSLLQSQTLIQLLDRRHESKNTSRRLMRSLRDNDLTGKFMVSLALRRQACVFDREYSSAPLKFLANLFDEIHQIMIQYLELLRANLTPDEFRTLVPDVVQLLVEYQIPAEIAFLISRPTIAKRMVEVDRDAAERRKAGGDVAESTKELTNADVEMIDEMNSEEDGEEIETDNNITEAVATPTPAEISGSALEADSPENQDLDMIDPEEAQQWHPVLEELITAITPSLPGEIVELVGPGFYVTFWQLSLYDIIIPGKSYEDELSRQHKKIAAINADRSDVSVAGTRKKEAEKKQISDLLERLLSENKDHLKAFSESKARLFREKDQWFAGKGRIYEQLNSALMEHCFLPRLLFSPLDSYFCFKFVKFLHAAGTPNFRTLGFYDLIFKQDRLSSLIFMCTSKEADNLGRFLNEILRDLGRWHKDKFVYEKEAFGFKRNLPGFAMKLDGGRPAVFLDYESFRRILYKWHQLIFGAMQACFASTDYMHIRNAISVLRSIYVHFPAINFHGTALLKSVGDLEKSGKEDLTIASRSLMSALRHQEKTWILPQAFRKGQEKPSDNGTMKTDSSETKTSEAKPVLDSKQPAKANAEDGEVADAAMADMLPASKEATTNGKAVAMDAKESESKAPAPLSKPPAVEKPSTAPLPTRANGPENTRNVRVTLGRSTETRNPDLPKRVSPPPRPHDLPNRPESHDSRSLTRDIRMPPRPPYNQDPRYPSEGRLPPNPRRPGERLPEPFERSHDQGRTYERGQPRPVTREEYASRGERGTRFPNEERFPRSTREPAPSGHSSDRSARPRPTNDPRTERPEASSQSAPLPVKPASTTIEPAGINPDRAAMIVKGLESRPDMNIRGQAQESSHTSRPSSPSRNDERKHTSRYDRESDDRQNRVRDQHPRASVGHTSSRNDRTGPSGGYDSRTPYNRTVDMQHGRLEQDFSQRPQSQGQSNGDGEVPSGPKSRTSMPRSRPLPPPHVKTDTPSIPTAPAERPTPTGPSARPHTRNNSYADQPSASPAAVSSGVHPDRLNQILPSPTEVRPPAQSRPAPVVTASTPTQSSPPLGPRGGNAPAGAPSGPSPTTRGSNGMQAPSGPHNSEISGRGRNNRHPLTAVNNTLQQAGQGASIRGRGGRQSSGPVSPHVGPPVNGQGPRSEVFIPPPALETRGDLFGSNSGSQRSERESRRPDESGERKSTRHASGRTSPERDSRSDRRDAPREERQEREHPSRSDDARRSGRDGNDDRRGYSASRNEHGRGPPRSAPEGDLQGRKHGRADEGAQYGSGRGGGMRNASDTKRRRGAG